MQERRTLLPLCQVWPSPTLLKEGWQVNKDAARIAVLRGVSANPVVAEIPDTKVPLLLWQNNTRHATVLGGGCLIHVT